MTQPISCNNIMHLWFMYLFEKRMDMHHYIKCFECDKLLHEDIYKELSTCYSHLLEKEKYPMYAGDEKNVVIVCPDCHNLYTMKPKKAFNQYQAAQELKKLYNL